MFYFEILQLNPIRFNVSFLTIPKGKQLVFIYFLLSYSVDEKIEYQNYAFLDALLEYLQYNLVSFFPLFLH